MKRLDRLILGELIGPWLFGVAVFTTLIMAGSFLFKLTEYAVKGIGGLHILQLALLMTPGVMAKTFPMAVLLATLLGFGRLSSDSELIALRACGASLGRIMVPVAAFGLIVALLTFMVNEAVVPAAAYRAELLSGSIGKTLKMTAKETTIQPVVQDGVLRAVVIARSIDAVQGTLTNVAVVAYDEQGDPNYIMRTPALKFSSPRNWQIQGGAEIVDFSGVSAKVGQVWPDAIPEPDFTFQDLITRAVKDPDIMSMARTREEIDRAIAESKVDPSFSWKRVRDLEYKYWNKIAVPLAALVYALVGAPFGIRNHRTGAAAGFWISVIIIFGYMTLASFMAIYAQGGLIPSYVASFTPLAIGLGVAATAIHRKNS